MKFVEHKLATGAMLTGYLRDRNHRNAQLQHPPGSADPARAAATATAPRAKRTLLPSSFCRPAYHVFTRFIPPDHAPLLWQPLTEAASAILYLRRNAADRALRRIRSPSLAFLPVPTWRLPPPCCGMQLPCSRPLVLPEPKPAPMRWCWGTPLSPAASLPTAALLRTCAARMRPCCRP